MQIALPTTAKRDHHPRPPASPPPPRRAGTQEGGGTKTVVADSSFGRVTKMTAAQVGRQAGRHPPPINIDTQKERKKSPLPPTSAFTAFATSMHARVAHFLGGWLAGWSAGCSWLVFIRDIS